MAPSDSRSVNRYHHGPLVCKLPINVTVPVQDLAFDVHGTPNAQLVTVDGDEHFIEIPPPSGRGRPRLSLRAMIVPNFNAQRRTVS